VPETATFVSGHRFEHRTDPLVRLVGQIGPHQFGRVSTGIAIRCGVRATAKLRMVLDVPSRGMGNVAHQTQVVSRSTSVFRLSGNRPQPSKRHIAGGPGLTKAPARALSMPLCWLVSYERRVRVDAFEGQAWRIQEQ
jgi:hypothetical protein